MTRKQIGAILGAVVLAVAAPLLMLAVLHTLDGTAEANPDTITVGLDMDPYSAPANSCPGDGSTDCTLGTIEECVEVLTGGGPVEFDIYLDDLPSGEDFAGWSAQIGERDSTLVGPITAYTWNSASVNLIAQATGSGNPFWIDLHDPIGTNVPGFDAFVADGGTPEANPPYTQGTLGRYTVDTTGRPDGVYRLTLPEGLLIIGNASAQNLCTIHTCDILDGHDGYGLIAVGEPCPGEAVITTVAIDMDPTGNDDQTVGTIESCVSVSDTPGTTFYVDVVLDAIPNFGGGRTNDFGAFYYELNFPDTEVKIKNQQHTSSGVNLIDRAPGSGPYTDLSDPVEDATTPHYAELWDTDSTAHEGAGDNNWSGGVLGRYQIEVLGGATPGIYELTLTPDNQWMLAVGDADYSGGGPYRIWDNPDDLDFDHDQDGDPDEDILLDGNSIPQYGLIAIGVDCPGAVVADLEKDDVYVKPFYCGDSDMDGDENTGTKVLPGFGTCCDGVDNNADTVTDGWDANCLPHINEDGWPWGTDDDGDGLVDEDPYILEWGPQCPFNGDDDCDGAVDEDPKNEFDDDLDGRIDEDPANGFLGIDNDRDGFVDEDGAGRYDFSGDTMIDAVQYEGWDDDGDTSVDEDPLDSRVKSYDPYFVEHEPHYLIKEVLLNNGPAPLVTAAESYTEIDAPGWRANAKEDGLTTCLDGQNNNDNDSYIDAADPECHNPHIGEEDAGIHACNDDVDNGAVWGTGGDGKDELDSDCETQTEVSVEITDPFDLISVKEGVHAYVKVRDPVHNNKCQPPKIPLEPPYDVGPPGGYEVPASLLTHNAVTPGTPVLPGDCIVVDSEPDVYKELDFHQWVDVPFDVETMSIDPWPEGPPVPTVWTDGSMDNWWLWMWVDEDESGDLTEYDQIWMEKELPPYEASWFRVFSTDPEGGPPPSMVVQEKTIVEHQYDLACGELPSLHRFTIQNSIHPPLEVIDPEYENNFAATEMLVACTNFADGEIEWVATPTDPWDTIVSMAIMAGVDLTAYNFHLTPNDFLVTLEAFSPGLGLTHSGGQMPDADGDDWADVIEGMLWSDPSFDWSTPESIHAAGTCTDGVDNDDGWGQDASDLKCMDTDGDGFSNGEELMLGSDWIDPAKTPEHMQFPWTCDDDVDNDGDDKCDDDGCTAYPGSGNAEPDSGDNGDSADCSIEQLTTVRPPVMCASGWGGGTGITYPGTTYEVYVAGNGDLTVRANLPIHGVTGAGFPIDVGLVFHCFAPGAYPRQELKATIQPLDPHVVDLALVNEEVTAGFEGTATCADLADLQLVDWRFAPAPPQVFPIGEWYETATTKEIHNAGPNPANAVRVRKSMNVPLGCEGYVEVAYSGETVSIAGNTVYEIVPGSGPQVAPPAGIDLEEGADVDIGDRIFVPGTAPHLLPENQPEIFAVFTPISSLGVGATDYAYEDFGMMCYGEGDFVFSLGNQVTLANYPTECDPNLGNISMDIPIEARARTCNEEDSDTDGFTANVECYLDTDPWYKCPLWTDADVGGPGDCPGVDCDGHDAYPLDINVDGFVQVVTDVLHFRGHIGYGPGEPEWWQRLDLNKDDYLSVVGDVLKFRGNIGECIDENGNTVTGG